MLLSTLLFVMHQDVLFMPSGDLVNLQMGICLKQMNINRISLQSIILLICKNEDGFYRIFIHKLTIVILNNINLVMLCIDQQNKNHLLAVSINVYNLHVTSNPWSPAREADELTWTMNQCILLTNIMINKWCKNVLLNNVSYVS